jgi:hypothetical protein
MRRAICIIAAVAVSGLMLTSCEKMGKPGDVSEAIINLVEALQPNSVDEYLYNSEKVYHFDNWSGPDDMTYLYSQEGVMMAAFGGFTGKGDGRCIDFFETAQKLRTIYSDGHWLRHDRKVSARSF